MSARVDLNGLLIIADAIAQEPEGPIPGALTGSQLHGAIRSIAGPDATIIMGGASVDVTLPSNTSRDQYLRVRKDIADVLPFSIALRAEIRCPPDPRIAREQRRREISAVLAEDRRRFPAFATARMRAVVAHVERCDGYAHSPNAAATVLGWLHDYEKVRGGMSKPSAEAWRLAARLFGWGIADLYERTRADK